MPATPAVTPDDLVVRSHSSQAAGITLPYRLYVPRDYLQSKRYPLLTVLHGSGERGADNERQLVNGVLAFCEPRLQKAHPTFVIYPQCPDPARWVESDWKAGRYEMDQVPASAPLRAVVELIAAVGKEFSIDPAALLLAGLSMGGYGTWDLLGRHPGLFAAAMPICGGGDPAKAPLMKDVAVWAFHGGADEVVPVTGSRLMVNALRKAGGRVRYTEYPGVGHRAWERALVDRRAITWLLAQRRRASGKRAAVLDGKASGL
jgi:predicted peptidase